MKYIVFSDIDGTLVDFSSYSLELSITAVKYLQEKQVPLILCSSKTRAEVELYRNKISCQDPFIAENGGGIYIPEGYFPKTPIPSTLRDGYHIIELGVPYSRLRTLLEDLRSRTGYPIKGMGDMTLEEICRHTGLLKEEAELARRREFNEPFIIENSHPDMSILWQFAAEMGVNITKGGRFYHILGKNDKGVAVKRLSALFANQFGEIATIALGDSPNDLTMLQATDMPVLVQRPGGYHDPDVRMRDLYLVPGVGPAGWNSAIKTLIP